MDYLDSRSKSANSEIISPVPPYVALGYNGTTIRSFVERTQSYNLTKSEVLMILNLKPTDLGLLDCIVEECDERFSGEQQEQLLQIIEEVFGELAQESTEHSATNGATTGVNGHDLRP